MEVIGNALELRAFDRMEEDIRLVGYFKNKDSEREYLSFFLVKRGCEELCIMTGLHLNPAHLLDLRLHLYQRCSHSCHSLVPTHTPHRS